MRVVPKPRQQYPQLFPREAGRSVRDREGDLLRHRQRDRLRHGGSPRHGRREAGQHEERLRVTRRRNTRRGSGGDRGRQGHLYGGLLVPG